MTLSVLAINGSPLKDKGNTAQLMAEFLKGLSESGSEVEVEEVYLSELNIKPCLGKLVCWVKTPGKCCQNDDMRNLLTKLSEADIWVFSSPIYWDGVTGPMKNLFDRLLPMIEPLIELQNGHCRHALRPGIKTGKIVFISSCGFWELDNFQPAVQHIKAVSKNIHREFAGALLRPHGALLKYMAKKGDMVQNILAAARAAGLELITKGKISSETLDKVSSEFLTIDEYMTKINENFKSLMEKNKK